MHQEAAWFVSLALIGVLAAVFGWVVSGSGDRVDYHRVQTRGYLWRKRLFAALVAVGVPITGWTLADLPYSAPLEQGGEAVHIKATGYQWFWQLDKSTVQVGQPVVFHVETADVNHGFGIYDESMRLLAQTQAMPGYTNKLAYTFEKPGTYRILCLEYCGAAHHQMQAEFTVEAANSRSADR
jgi:cytochrome c oxidase subunit 2